MGGLYRAVGEQHRDPKAPKFCDACFSGDYPIRMTDEDATKEGQLSFLAEVG